MITDPFVITERDIDIAENWRRLAVELKRQSAMPGINDFASRDLVMVSGLLSEAALTQDHGEGIRRRNTTAPAAQRQRQPGDGA